MRNLQRRLMSITIALLMISGTLQSAVAADVKAPTTPPSGIPSDVWDAFYASSFVIEGNNANTRRWTQPPTISLLGSPNSQDISTASNLINKLGKICPNFAPKLDVSNSIFNANIYFVPQRDYAKYIASADITDDSYLYYIYYTGSGLRTVTTVINSSLADQSDRDYWTTIRILQNMGMLTFTSNRDFALLSRSILDPEGISEKDKELLALFCSSALFPGDSFQTSTKSVQAMLDKRANQAPKLSASIEVAPFTNSASVKISLTSVNDLLAAGTFTMNYEVLDNTGVRIDNGSESNEQNRLQNQWTFDISGLEASSKYKINLNFSNSAGTGKSITQSFSTAEGFVETPSEQVEQTISLFDLPSSAKFSDKSLGLVISTSSGLDTFVESLTPAICDIDGLEVQFLKPGKCEFRISQDGDEDFLPAEDVFGSFYIQGATSTITCTKGKLVKKVTGANPKCPAGYKRK